MSQGSVHEEITGAIAKPKASESDLAVRARKALGGTVARVGGGLVLAGVVTLFAARKRRGSGGGEA